MTAPLLSNLFIFDNLFPQFIFRPHFEQKLTGFPASPPTNIIDVESPFCSTHNAKARSSLQQSKNLTAFPATGKKTLNQTTHTNTHTHKHTHSLLHSRNINFSCFFYLVFLSRLFMLLFISSALSRVLGEEIEDQKYNLNQLIFCSPPFCLLITFLFMLFYSYLLIVCLLVALSLLMFVFLFIITFLSLSFFKVSSSTIFFSVVLFLFAWKCPILILSVRQKVMR